MGGSGYILVGSGYYCQIRIRIVLPDPGIVGGSGYILVGSGYYYLIRIRIVLPEPGIVGGSGYILVGSGYYCRIRNTVTGTGYCGLILFRLGNDFFYLY